MVEKFLPCPICWHEQVRMCVQDSAVTFDDIVKQVRLKRRVHKRGPGGQELTRWDAGYWECSICGARFTSRDLEVLANVVFRPFPWGMTEDDWQDLNEIQSVVRGDT